MQDITFYFKKFVFLALSAILFGVVGCMTDIWMASLTSKKPQGFMVITGVMLGITFGMNNPRSENI